LPVATGKLLVGLVSDRDIKRASPSILQGIDKSEFERMMEDTPVSRIMTREPFTVKETTPLVEAVSILIEKKFGSLPVVDGKELVGIFTEIDALKVLLDTLNKK
jgi:acetoin utilization protein AcuB